MRPLKLSVEQKMYVEIVKLAELNETRWPFLSWLHHIDNEGKRHPSKTGWFGIRKGVSDYMLPVPTAQYNGLFLEVKAPGKKLQPAQSEFLIFASSMGYRCFWSDNLQQIIDFLHQYCQEAQAYLDERSR